jgi:hypothetical protein
VASLTGPVFWIGTLRSAVASVMAFLGATIDRTPSEERDEETSFWSCPSGKQVGRTLIFIEIENFYRKCTFYLGYNIYGWTVWTHNHVRLVSLHVYLQQLWIYLWFLLWFLLVRIERHRGWSAREEKKNAKINDMIVNCKIFLYALGIFLCLNWWWILSLVFAWLYSSMVGNSLHVVN